MPIALLVLVVVVAFFGHPSRPTFEAPVCPAIEIVPPAQTSLDSGDPFSFVVGEKIVLSRGLLHDVFAHDNTKRVPEDDDAYFFHVTARVDAGAALPPSVTRRFDQQVTLYAGATPVCTARIKRELFLYSEEQSHEGSGEAGLALPESELDLVASLDTISGNCANAHWARASELLPPSIDAPQPARDANVVFAAARKTAEFGRTWRALRGRPAQRNADTFRLADSEFSIAEIDDGDGCGGESAQVLLDDAGRELSNSEGLGRIEIIGAVDLDRDGVFEILYRQHGTTLGVARIVDHEWKIVHELTAAPFCPC